jgi:hypothetical protein
VGTFLGPGKIAQKSENDKQASMPIIGGPVTLRYTASSEEALFDDVIYFILRAPLTQLVKLDLSLHRVTFQILAQVLRVAQSLETLVIWTYIDDIDNFVDVRHHRSVSKCINHVDIVEDWNYVQTSVTDRLLQIISPAKSLAYRHYHYSSTSSFLWSLKEQGWSAGLRVMRLSFFRGTTADDVAPILDICPNLQELHITLATNHDKLPGLTFVDITTIHMLAHLDGACQLHTLTLHIPPQIDLAYVKALADLISMQAVRMANATIATSSQFTLRLSRTVWPHFGSSAKAIQQVAKRQWNQARLPYRDTVSFRFESFCCSVYEDGVGL